MYDPVTDFLPFLNNFIVQESRFLESYKYQEFRAQSINNLLVLLKTL